MAVNRLMQKLWSSTSLKKKKKEVIWNLSPVDAAN